jgi:hypothetical protein
MKVAIVRGGGVAGLTSRTRLDSAALPPADVATLEQRVRRAGLLAEQAEGGGAPGHPDAQLYAVTVEDSGRERTHRFSEDGLPDELRALVAWIDARPESEHGVDRG